MRIRTLQNGLITLIAVAAVGCGGGRLAYNTPPAQQLLHPGPGVGGPGPGVIPVGGQATLGAPTGPAWPIGPGGSRAGGCEGGACGVGGAAVGAALAADDASFTREVEQVQFCQDGGCQDGGCQGGGGFVAGPGATSQIAFVGEEGLQIAWSVSSGAVFDSAPIVVPARQDFPQGAIYRLKLTGVPGRPGVSLYPTLEVAPVTPRTDAYLAHAPIPVQFTEEDFDQVLSGNFVTKVIYLPDPEFQELALAGVETLVSTRLDPGCDPVSEADSRGSILAIVRIGSKDLEGASNQFQGGVLPAQFDSGSGSREVPPASFGDQGFPIQAPVQGEVLHDGGHAYQSGPVYDEAAGPSPGFGPAGVAPVGAPTAGFAPPAVPPHLIAGAPQYGHPITGTPIGLPGPPHIPHGSPAGLQRHVIKNRTRVVLPPPTPQVNVTVKQRPGLNYPRPVNSIRIDEAPRTKANLFSGTLPGPGQVLLGRLKSKVQSKHADNCEDCQ